jgi:hypothetical protein
MAQGMTGEQSPVSRESLIPLFAWLGHTAVGTTIRSSAVLIALTEIIHLLGLTMLIGTVLMVDMALLGFGIRRHPASRIATELAPWTTGGLVVMLISGPLILSSETLKCYEASFFWIKMAVLLAAIAFHFTVHRRVARLEPPAGRFRAGIVACVSLGLWISVALAGKMIGIYGDDLRVDPAPFAITLSYPAHARWVRASALASACTVERNSTRALKYVGEHLKRPS